MSEPRDAEQSASYMTTEDIPLPYCPGCGHTTLVRALDTALVEIQLDPREVVIVTDIGCIGLADRNFTTNAFHGLHGRSITYACGLKLARPELTVVAIMGDGACGIGGAHLLNVARRNIGITLLVANNFNYGMTGGQHSVTTPCGGITATTPFGNVEQPMDICATAAAAGAAWVYRATSFDRDLPQVLAGAIREPGFALVDCWELCTAYYMPRNKLKKSDLVRMLEPFDLSFGQIVDVPRPEYSLNYRESFANTGNARRDPPKIEVEHENAVDRRCGILIAGAAGQKIKSSATLFARAAIASGLCATQKDDYPITIMTGHSLSEVVLDREPIAYTGIPLPDRVLVLAEQGVQRAGACIAALPATSILYADEALELPATEARVLRYPFALTAKSVGRFTLGIVALAAFLEETGLFPTEALADAIEASQEPKTAESSLKALAAGKALVQ
ncbi:MAG: thiamine pyrophosphate-dependent enzyme [Planctomycetota bacterium]